MYTLKMAEISSGRSLKPNIPRELKLGYVLWLQRLKKTPGNAMDGIAIRHGSGEIMDKICTVLDLLD